MVDGVPQDFSQMAVGPERRAVMRESGMGLTVEDFTAEEWLAIEAEAPGTRVVLEAQLREAEDALESGADPCVRSAAG